MKTQRFAGKRILLTAFSVQPGSEAMAAYEYLKQHGATDISTAYWGGEEIASKVPDDVVKLQIDDRTAINQIDLSQYDLVFRHTNTPPQLLKGAKQVTSVTREFFEHCAGTIIGVTGTKGKGTTSTLIHKMLQAAGCTSHLVGNIGIPAVSALDKINVSDYVVAELSSFQLWDLPRSPHIAVVLMMEPEHLDVHSDMEEYVQAKSQIARNQAPEDIVVYHRNRFSEEIANTSPGTKLAYMEPPAARIERDTIVCDDTEISPVQDVALPGPHNLENICAAVTAAWQVTKDAEAMATVISNFKGLEHRLQLVREINGVSYYDDSFATTPGTAIAALKSFKEPKVMILGGSDKGSDYTELAKEITGSNVPAVVLVGDMAERIKDCLEETGYQGKIVEGLQDMKGTVQAAAEKAPKGSVVLLSPACASFGLFKNYKDRGEQFRQAVLELL